MTFATPKTVRRHSFTFEPRRLVYSGGYLLSTPHMRVTVAGEMFDMNDPEAEEGEQEEGNERTALPFKVEIDKGEKGILR